MTQPQSNKSSKPNPVVGLVLAGTMIALLVSTAGVPSLRPGSTVLDQAELRIAEALERARDLARGSRQTVGVVFEPAEDRFAVVGADGKVAIEPLTRWDFIVEFDEVDIEAADFGELRHALVFDPQGVPASGGTITLKIGNQRRALAIDAATGDLVRS